VGSILSSVLMVIGAFVMLLAALGVVRMPDLFTRMHASTKSATLGVACLMLGAAVHFGELAIAARALAVVAFVFFTAPVAAHMIARAAYFSDVPLWDGTLSDELRDRYDEKSHTLHSQSADQRPEPDDH
jgi:multicomponent Na+:H+ antiporter subunit G